MTDSNIKQIKGNKMDTPSSNKNEETITKPQGEAGSENNQTPEELLANAEKRIQDNRTAFLKASKEAAEAKQLNEVLTKKLYEAASGVANLSTEEKQKLEDLKYSNPDKWMEELTRLNKEAAANLETTLNEARQEAGKQAKKISDDEAIKEFQKANPNVTMDMLQTNVPYQLKVDFDSGKLNVQEFLEKANHFFNNATITEHKEEVPNQLDLTKANGSSEASKNAKDKVSIDNYANVTF